MQCPLDCVVDFAAEWREEQTDDEFDLVLFILSDCQEEEVIAFFAKSSLDGRSSFSICNWTTAASLLSPPIDHYDELGVCVCVVRSSVFEDLYFHPFALVIVLDPRPADMDILFFFDGLSAESAVVYPAIQRRGDASKKVIIEHTVIAIQYST